MNEVMEELMEILEDICPDVEFEGATTLIDDQILSSFEILSIISDINETFEIKLGTADLIPPNFNSVEAMCAMICKKTGR